MINLNLPGKLQPFFEKKKRFKIAYGGRGGAKSQSFAGMLLTQSRYQAIKVGCFREYQNSIEDSVHQLLRDEIERIGLSGYKVDKTHIDNQSGGFFRFKGLSRAIGSVKSMQGFDKFWTEEAQFLSKESLKTLTPTLRGKDSEAWFSMNPGSSADPMSQRFLEPFRRQLDRDGIYEDDLHLIVKINWADNPWFPEGLNQERLFDKLNLSDQEYQHVWEGAYNDTIEGAIINPEWFEAAINAHERLGFKAEGRKVVSHDPSDTGPDDKGLCVRHGSVITDADFMDHGDAADGMDWALDRAIEEKADLFTWDCDGLGVSLKRQVSNALEGKHCRWAMFKGSEGVDRPEEPYNQTGNEDEDNCSTNKQVFRNKRAQYYGNSRDRFFNTYRAVEKGDYVDPGEMISISKDIKNLVALKAEMCRIPKKYNGNGLFQIMNKDEMKRLKIKSPNMADSKMMCLRWVEPSNDISEWDDLDINTNYVV